MTGTDLFLKRIMCCSALTYVEKKRAVKRASFLKEGDIFTMRERGYVKCLFIILKKETMR